MGEQAIIEHEGEEGKAVEPTSESAAIFSIIERAARDPNVDLDKMERLMAMRERELARVAEKAFHDAMQAAQKQMPQVVRDAANDQTRSRYARYETISKAIQPVIAEHGFSLSFGTDTAPAEGHMRIVCDVSHKDGHSKQYHADIPVDNVGMKGNPNKTATHAFGSTISYGKRYLKTLIFDVAVTDEDDDGNTAGSNSISDEQQIQLRELIEVVGIEEKKFLEFGKVESLAEIETRHFDNAVTRLKEYGRKRGVKV